MKDNLLISYALKVAVQAHYGQTDKGGHDYINHPIRIAEKASTTTEKVVALLHDVLEDSDITYDELVEWFGENIAHSVYCLTRQDDESYKAYMLRIDNNPVARAVKILDLEDNMDLSRLGREPEQHDYDRKAKYHRWYTFLKRQKELGV